MMLDMAKRVMNTIGSVYRMYLDDGRKVYLQYVAIDRSMLNSGVLRVFKKKYSQDDVEDIEEIVRGEVWFYTHTSLRPAIRDGCWKKIDSSRFWGDTTNIKFRLYSEGNTSHLTVSHKWYVWTINQENIHIGDLTGEYKKYDMGWLYPPSFVCTKIKTGKYPNHELE